jgi:hypothetical protein
MARNRRKTPVWYFYQVISNAYAIVSGRMVASPGTKPNPDPDSSAALRATVKFSWALKPDPPLVLPDLPEGELPQGGIAGGVETVPL